MNDSANTLASQWMKQGIALLNQRTPQGYQEAIACFDRAITLRRQLPLAAHPWFRYGLIAGWMNRADALTRLGSPENLAEAMISHSEALTHLSLLPVDSHPLFRRRFAIAWLNRGVTLQAQNTAASLREALPSFDQVIRVLNSFVPLDSEGRSLLAAAWVNRGNALLQLSPARPDLAREAARKGNALIADSEQHEVLSAEISLKARQVACRAIAEQLPETFEDASTTETLVAEATEAVDEGMKLARHWELRGHTGLRSWAGDLFRFGARVYQMYQPHFLTEFLLESVDPEQSPGAWANDPGMHLTALEAVWRTVRSIQRDVFKSVRALPILFSFWKPYVSFASPKRG